MSVEYNSGIAEGWLFTKEERNIFNERTNYEFEDDFIFPDAYDGVGDSIFGQWILKNPNVGTAINFTTLKSKLDLAEWIALAAIFISFKRMVSTCCFRILAGSTSRLNQLNRLQASI